MKIVKSTKNHKLWYQFPYFVEFVHDHDGTLEWVKWSKHFEQLYGPSAEHKMIEGHTFSTWHYNSNWREEHNKKQKRLRIYVKAEKDITWAMLNLV